LENTKGGAVGRPAGPVACRGMRRCLHRPTCSSLRQVRALELLQAPSSLSAARGQRFADRERFGRRTPRRRLASTAWGGVSHEQSDGWIPGRVLRAHGGHGRQAPGWRPLRARSRRTQRRRRAQRGRTVRDLMTRQAAPETEFRRVSDCVMIAPSRVSLSVEPGFVP
jgi:hypothetical protein